MTRSEIKCLNPSLRGLNESPTLSINQLSNDLRKQGRKIFNLGLGQSPFPIPQPLIEALRLYAEEKKYLPVRGLDELCEAVANYHHVKDSVIPDKDLVMIGPGSKELLFLLQVVFTGGIILPTPCWVSYVPQAKIIGRKIQFIHTNYDDRWRLKSDQLETFLSRSRPEPYSKILVMNYPGNPDGLTYAESELKSIADIARKYQLIILSDEIYAGIHHKGCHVSIARYYPEGTIISSGISKWCGAGGWRLGTFIFPPQLRWILNAMLIVASETYTSVSAPIQYAAVRAFKEDVYIERYLLHVRRILCDLGNYGSHLFQAEGLKVHDPEGAFYLFVDFSRFRERLAQRGITTNSELSQRLLDEAQVAVLPGSVFNRPDDELTIRIAYVNFNGARALTASETIPSDQSLPNDFIMKWCGNTVKAFNKIIEWTLA